MHERQAIRDAVVAQLIGPSPYTRTAAGQRVYKTRGGPVREADLPCVCVFVQSETCSLRLQTSEREASLVVEGYVKAAPTADLDAVLDDLALQIETAMDLDKWLGGTAGACELTKTTLETSMMGALPMGRAALEYSVTYEAPVRVADAPDDFHTADIRTSLSGAQATADQSHDVVMLP